jgi:hypothetical protein
MIMNYVSSIKKFFKKRVLFLCCIIFFSHNAFAATFTLEANNSTLSFGVLRNGEWRETGSSDYQVTCRSDGGSTWYLKIQLFSPLFSGMSSIEDQYLKWMGVWTDGSGILSNQYQYNPFNADTQMLVYTSGSTDNSGNAINIQLKFGILVPTDQISGNYNGVVRYIMTETL